MAYDPFKYKKDYSAIGQVGNIAAQTVMKVTEIQQAAKEAKANWNAMENAYKSIKSAYQKQATPLIQSGVLSEDELENSLGMLPPPTPIHKKNPEGYLSTLQSGWRNLVGNLEKKQEAMQQAQRSQAIGGAVSEELTGRRQEKQILPTSREPLEGPMQEGVQREQLPQENMLTTQGPPAKTKEQAFGSVSGQQYPGGPVTTEEFEQYGGKYLPTGLELLTQKTDEEHKRKMRARGYSKDAEAAEMKKLDMIRKMRNDETSKLNRLETQKKSLVNIKKSIEKGETFGVDEASALSEYGINGQELQDMATVDPDKAKAMVDEMLQEVDARSKVQKRNSSEVEKAYVDLLSDPGADIFKTLKKGRKEATGQMFLDQAQEATQRTQTLAGGAPAMGLPERGTGMANMPPEVGNDPMAQGIWETIQSKVQEGRLSPQEAKQYFDEYMARNR